MTTFLAPAPQRAGESLTHADPAELAEVTTCKVCSVEVMYDGADEPDDLVTAVGVWVHIPEGADGGYFCDPPEPSASGAAAAPCGQ